MATNMPANQPASSQLTFWLTEVNSIQIESNRIDSNQLKINLKLIVCRQRLSFVFSQVTRNKSDADTKTC